MRNKSVIAFLLVLASLTTQTSRLAAQSGTEIAGQVVDAKGDGVANVIVSIVDLGIETQTDARGRFSFGNVAPGDYTLTFRRSGMSTVSLSHVRPGAPNVTATLSSSAVVIESPAER